MKKWLLCVVLFSFIGVNLCEAQGQMMWHDEFNGPQLDKQKWQVIEEKPYKNNERQVYRAANVHVDEGYLMLSSEKQKGSFTSGAVQTKLGYAIHYGKIAIRAKLPTGQGVFPAIWMLPVKDQALPEIDLLELVGHKPNELWGVYHYFDGNGRHQKKYFKCMRNNWTTTFHTFTLDWKPNLLIWKIDGQEVFRTNRSPSVVMKVIINTAIGGNWPGNPTAATHFPQTLLVDWVRVYNES